MRSILDVAGPVAILAAFVLAALMLVPAAFGFQRYVITTGSMTGSYDAGALVYDKQVPVEDLRVGDVITYRPPADANKPGLVTHRIASIERDAAQRLSFRTKGDANQAADEWTFVPTEATMNRVAYGVPHLGRAYSFLNSREGRILIFMIPALLIASASLGRLWREAGEATHRETEAAHA